MPGLSGDTFPPSSDGTYDVSNTEVEEDVVVIEESYIAVKKDEDIGMKQEEIPQDITFPDIKSEPDKVCYVCMCLLLDTFYWCPVYVCCVCDITISGCLKELHFWE
jgi:hypothetical protein